MSEISFFDTDFDDAGNYDGVRYDDFYGYAGSCNCKHCASEGRIEADDTCRFATRP
jgi:hypothetical protein